MIFTHPWALALLAAPVLFAALFAASFRWKARVFASLGDAAVLRRLVDPLARRHQAVKAVLLTLAAACFALALAGPRWGRKFQEVQRRGVDVVIAVDVSASMLAEDIKPNRLTQAKRELGLLVDRFEGDRVGLVAFAGAAFLQCPLTLDYGAARSLLELFDTDLVSRPGTSLAAAVETAVAAFVRTERKHKALVLLTDGEDHSERLAEALKAAQAEGVRVFAIGFGNPQGEIIPVRDERGELREYKKDKSGRTVVSKLDEAALRDIAGKTGGRYYRATNGEVEVERLLSDLRGMDKKSLESRVYGQYEDRYRWPLVAALVLLFLEFLWPESRGHYARVLRALREKLPSARGGIPAGVAAALILLAPSGGHARGRAPDVPPDVSRAVEHYRRAAEKAPQDPRRQFNLGNALYRGKDYKAAQEAFERAQAATPDEPLRTQSAYNAGNALFRQTQFDGAVERYKQALRLDPRDLDAKHNLELAQKMLKLKQQSKPDQGKEGDKKDDSKKESGGAPRPASAQESKEGMSKEDAERLLKALEDQQKEARKKARQAQPKEAATEEDW